MKKTYLHPETTVVTIAPVLMTNGSVQGFTNSLGTEGGNGDKALGRGGNDMWDDEEDY